MKSERNNYIHMTNEELIAKARYGCKESEELLFKNNQHLIYSIVNRYNFMEDIDDLISIGNIGLFKAYKEFDMSQGVKFSTYLFNAIRGQITTHLRKVDKVMKNEKSLNFIVYKSHKNGEKLRLLDIHEDHDSKKEFERVENKDIIQQVMELFAQKEKKRMVDLVNWLYVDDMTQIEIARMLGLSHQRISYLKKKIDSKLKEYYLKIR